jgi:hypothetical protein
MAGYQTIEMLRPILHRGPVPTPVVDSRLVRPKGGFVSKQGRRTPYWVLQEIVERRRTGEPIASIAKATGVSTCTVVKHTKHVPPPPGGWPTCWVSRPKRNVKEEFARRLRRSGFTWAEISEECGVADSVIRYRIGAKQRYPRRTSPLQKAKWRIAAITGVKAAEIVRDPNQTGRAPELISRTRMILFWVGRNRLGLSNRQIGEQLGGFDRDMVGYCVRRVDLAMASAGVASTAPVGRITRALLNAEWPKASA